MREATKFTDPYGDTGRVVESRVGACGYTVGLTCVSRPAVLGDSLLATPRIGGWGTWGLDEFVKRLDLA